jgi:hypothetical protein
MHRPFRLDAVKLPQLNQLLQLPPLLQPLPARGPAVLPFAAAALALFIAVTPSSAQNSYRCSSVNGPYYSDKPCPIQGGTTLGAIGPVPERPLYRAPPPPVGRAPEWQSRMSAACSSMADGLRTGASRGLTHTTLADLREDYQRRCAAEESAARQRHTRDQFSAANERGAAMRQANETARKENDQQQRQVAQCGEMRRIITNKNERIATLTPGEVGDLRRFEANYAERCGARLPPP